MVKMALIEYLKKYAVKMIDLRQDVKDLPPKKYTTAKSNKSKQQISHH